MSPVSNHLWEPAASSGLVGVPPTRREIPPRLGPSVRRWDLDAFRHVEGSIKTGQPSDPEGKGPVVPTWNNSGLHRSPPLAPVAATDSVARQRSVYGEPAQPTLWQRFASDMMRVSLACWVPAFRTVPRPDTDRGGRYGKSLFVCTSVRRIFILCSQRVRYCGLWGWLLSTISIRTSSAPRRMSTRR